MVTATASGTITPIATVEVKSQASGEITEVTVEEGQAVRKGQLLARVDQRIPKNAVAQAEADSAVAEASKQNAASKLRRAEELHKVQALTDDELETARFAFVQASAAALRAQRTLEDARIAFVQTEVRAPTDGVILGRAVEVGSVIASASRDVGGGAVLMRMAKLDTVEVQAMVDETQIGLVKPGAPVSIRVSAYPSRPFAGTVLRIGAEGVVQQNVTMFPVLARVANREGLLKPGMNADVVIRVAEARNVLAVPNGALREQRDLGSAAAMLGLTDQWVENQLANLEGEDDGDAYIAFTTRNDTVSLAAVRTGLTDFDYSAVESGLVAGDSVIILPTAGYLAEQQERQEWIDRRSRPPIGAPGASGASGGGGARGAGGRGGRGGGGR
jgi:HlyD family secretion protein